MKLKKDELKEFKDSEEYKFLSKFFDKSRCNNPEYVGHCMDILKEKQFKEFDEWVAYYVGHDDFRFIEGMVVAAGQLQNYILKTIHRRIKINLCFDAVATLVLYQSWNGWQMEKIAIEELKSDDYEIIHTNHKQDELYAIDLIIHKSNSPILAIQVKPSSYEKLSKEKKQVNISKNQVFYDRYNTKCHYMYYDFYKFSDKVVEETKRIIREAMKCKSL